MKIGSSVLMLKYLFVFGICFISHATGCLAEVIPRSPEDFTFSEPTPFPQPSPTSFPVPRQFIPRPQVVGKIKFTDAWSLTNLYSRRNNHTYIDGVFLLVLGRHARVGEQTNMYYLYFNSYFNNFSATFLNALAGTVSTIWNLDEHITGKTSSIFQHYFNRPPSPAELSEFSSLLRSGTNELELILRMITSSEYLTRHPSTQELIRGFYQDLLNRQPTAAEFATMENALTASPISAVARNFVYSELVLSKIVNSTYENNLFRSPSAAESANWLGLLKDGTKTPDDLRKSLLSSTEFYELAYRAQA